MKVGGRVWIRKGDAYCRGDNYPSPMLVEILDFDHSNFRAIPVDKSLGQIIFTYDKDEIIEPKPRKANFIGGVQHFQ